MNERRKPAAASMTALSWAGLHPILTLRNTPAPAAGGLTGATLPQAGAQRAAQGSVEVGRPVRMAQVFKEPGDLRRRHLAGAQFR